MCILCPFILAGNGMTIIVIMTHIKKVLPTHAVIAFLAFAGMFVGVDPLLCLAVYLAPNSLESKQLFCLMRAMAWVTISARVLKASAILLIAVERFFLVMSLKLQHKFLTLRRQVGLCVGFGVYSMLLAAIYTTLAQQKIKQAYLVPMSTQKTTIILSLFVATYVLITCVIVCCYLKLCLFVWKQRKTMALRQNSSNQQNFHKEKKTTILIVIILTIYLVWTLPTMVYGLMLRNEPENLSVELWEFIWLVLCATSLVDILIYTWKVPEFQEGYRKILCCLQKSDRNQLVPWHDVQPNHGMNFPLEPRI